MTIPEVSPESRAARKAWETSLLTAQGVANALGVLKKEFELWSADGRITPALVKSGYLKGQKVETPLYDVSALRLVLKHHLQDWREQDLLNLTPAEQEARKKATARADEHRKTQEILANLEVEHDCVAQHDEDEDELHWVKTAAMDLQVVVENQEPQTWHAKLMLEARFDRPETLREAEALSKEVATCFSKDLIEKSRRQLEQSIEALLATCHSDLTAGQFTGLCKALQGSLRNAISLYEVQDNKHLQTRIGGPLRALLADLEARKAQALLQLKDYPQSFPLAREMNRKIHFKLGPTNSGKTYEALQALKAAQSGVYLAPLRLLAMELRDRLVAEGVPCNLLTGEEHEMMEGAKHTACTIEMMSAHKPVEVAIIDEIQMLQDDSRGWAWTAALAGVPAKDVFVCGAETCHQACENLFNTLGEPMDVTRLERKTSLTLETNKTKSSARNQKVTSGLVLQKGDALIAFSRKDVLTLSARYRRQGLSVATIYGALAPEVRRTEAARFSAGEADIIVATDAIGMGLNLPIRRIIFSAVHKFDGTAMRLLAPTEVHQIAGRAGRFGQYPEGFVTTLDPAELDHIRVTLGRPIALSRAKLPVAPHFWHIEALAKFLGTENMGPILSFFATRIAADSPLFDTAKLHDTISLSHAVDYLSREHVISLQDRFTFACAPVTADKLNEIDYFKTCFWAFLAGRKLDLPKAPTWLDGSSPSHLESAEFLSKDISLYAWLSFKFPTTFHQYEDLPALRSKVSRFIERALLQQGGFGQTSKESFDERYGR